jgi:hypothetical protein
MSLAARIRPHAAAGIDGDLWSRVRPQMDALHQPDGLFSMKSL